MGRIRLLGLIGTGAVGLMSLVGCEEDPEKMKKFEAAASSVVAVELNYDSRFGHYEQRALKDLGVEPEVANSYDKDRFDSGDEVVVLARAGVVPGEAKQLSEKLSMWDISQLKKANLMDHSIVNPYVDAFGYSIRGNDIATLVRAKISIERAKAWKKLKFSTFGMNNDGKFTWGQIARLDKLGKNPDAEVPMYDNNFTPAGAAHLIEEGVGHEEANRYAELNKKYWTRISGFDIVRYKEEGFSYEQVAEQAKKNWFERSVGE